MNMFHLEINGVSADALLPYVVVYIIFWTVVLGLALLRSDLEPVTQLMWVMTIIFVPVIGLLLYLFIAPSSPLTQRKKIDPSNSLSGTPWENDSAHTIHERNS